MRKTKKTPRGPQPRRIPRPFEKWLTSLFLEKEWKDSLADFPWLETVRQIANEYGCQIIFDVSHHWRESFFAQNFRRKGPMILAGGAGSSKHSCTSILHELGHLILHSKKHHPKDVMRGGEEAWQIAQRLALEHRLPLVSSIRRQALYSYRYHLVYQHAPGSKRKHRRRPPPKSWQLEGSKRTSKACARGEFYSTGKKAERRQKNLDD